MRIGVAKEIKSQEYRVALTPAGARELVQRGHEVVVETGAGVGSAFPDDAYERAGANDRVGRRRVVDGRAAPQGEGADRAPSTRVCATVSRSSRTSTSPPTSR